MSKSVSKFLVRASRRGFMFALPWDIFFNWNFWLRSAIFTLFNTEHVIILEIHILMCTLNPNLYPMIWYFDFVTIDQNEKLRNNCVIYHQKKEFDIKESRLICWQYQLYLFLKWKDSCSYIGKKLNILDHLTHKVNDNFHWKKIFWTAFKR